MVNRSRKGAAGGSSGNKKRSHAAKPKVAETEVDEAMQMDQDPPAVPVVAPCGGLKIRIKLAGLLPETNRALESFAEQRESRLAEETASASRATPATDSSYGSVHDEDESREDDESEEEASDDEYADLSTDEDDWAGESQVGSYWKNLSGQPNAFAPSPIGQYIPIPLVAPIIMPAPIDNIGSSSFMADPNLMRATNTSIDNSSSEDDDGMDMDLDGGFSPRQDSVDMWNSFDQNAFLASATDAALAEVEVDTPATTPGASGECESSEVLREESPSNEDSANLQSAVEMLAGLLPEGFFDQLSMFSPAATPQDGMSPMEAPSFPPLTARNRSASQSAKDFLRITIPLPQGPAPSPLSSPSVAYSNGEIFPSADDYALLRGLNRAAGSECGSMDGNEFALDLHRQLAIVDTDNENVCRVESSSGKSDVSVASSLQPGYNPRDGMKTSRRMSSPLMRQASASSLVSRAGFESPSKADRRRFPSVTPETHRPASPSSPSPRLRHVNPVEDPLFKQNLQTLLGPESVGVEDLDQVWGHVQAKMSFKGKKSPATSSRSSKVAGNRPRKQSITGWGDIGVGCAGGPEIKAKQERARFGQVLLERARVFAEQVSCKATSRVVQEDAVMDDAESCIGMDDVNQAAAATLDDGLEGMQGDTRMSFEEPAQSPSDQISPQDLSMLSSRHFSFSMGTSAAISPCALSTSSDRPINPFSPPMTSTSIMSPPHSQSVDMGIPIHKIRRSSIESSSSSDEETNNKMSSCLPAPIIQDRPLAPKPAPTRSTGLSGKPKPTTGGVFISPCVPMWPEVRAIVHESIPIFSVMWNGVGAVRRIDTDYGEHFSPLVPFSDFNTKH